MQKLDLFRPSDEDGAHAAGAAGPSRASGRIRSGSSA